MQLRAYQAKHLVEGRSFPRILARTPFGHYKRPPVRRFPLVQRLNVCLVLALLLSVGARGAGQAWRGSHGTSPAVFKKSSWSSHHRPVLAGNVWHSSSGENLPAGFTFAWGSVFLEPDGRIVFSDGRVTWGIQFEGVSRTAQLEVWEQEDAFNGLDLPATLADSLATRNKLLVFREIYPGIDLLVASQGAGIKTNWIVKPGANPESIQWTYFGDVVNASLAPAGELRVLTPSGMAIDSAPVAFQLFDGQWREVAASYHQTGSSVWKFQLTAYDPTRVLVIDPALSYLSFLGGSGIDYVTAVATDASGAVYLVGWTDSYDFLASSTISLEMRFSRNVDAFVVKFRPDTKQVLFARYLGGRRDDRALALVVDSAGNPWIVGQTESYDFPVTSTLQSRFGGGRDAFIVKLSGQTGEILWSSYFGGSGIDVAYAVGTTTDGMVYVAGETSSLDLPVRNAYQNLPRGSTDAFIVKIVPGSGQLAWSSYFGGFGDDRALALAVDASGGVWVGGETTSTNFPLKAPLRSVPSGSEGFVAHFSATGSLLWSSYLGGSAGGFSLPDSVTRISLASNGDVIAGGVTSSSDFPVVPEGSSSYRGFGDAFVTRIAADGSRYVFSRIIGGISADVIRSVKWTSSGTVVFSGFTSSVDFPVTNPWQAQLKGARDGFIGVLDGAGNVQWLSYVGGEGYEDISDVVAASSGIIGAGITSSVSLPASTNAIQSQRFGSVSGLLLIVDTGTTTNRPPVAQSDQAITESGQAVIINVLQNDSDPDGDVLTVTSVTQPPVGQVQIVSSTQIQYQAPANFTGQVVFSYTISDGRGGTASAQVVVTVNPPTPTNRPPVAQNDAASTVAGQELLIPVLANDSDPDGDPLVVISVTNPTFGQVQIVNSTQIRYVAPAGSSGQASFQYTISDGRGGTASATVTVTVQAGSSPPSSGPTDQVFVTQLYVDTYGNPPSQATLSYWTSRLSSGALTRPQVAEQVIREQGFFDPASFVVRMYEALAQRHPDHAGWRSWLNRLLSGTGKVQVLGQFLRMPGLPYDYMNMPPEDYVRVLYVATTGQQPSPVVVVNWATMIRNGMSREQVAYYFIESSTYKQRAATLTDINVAFLVFVQRPPTAQELQNWTTALSSGQVFRDLLAALIASSEYRSRFN